MRSLSLLKNRWGDLFTRRSLAGLLCVAIAGVSFGLHVPKAQASAELTFDVPEEITSIIDTIYTTLGTIATKVMEGYQWALKHKEMVLDGIAWYAAKILLAEMQKSMVRWIHSGFDGKPNFVQDLGGFLANTADKVAGQFIYGSGLKALCSPFAFNIKIALAVQYAAKDTPVRCTLSGVVNNIDGFMRGNFSDGGLAGWFQMTVNPNNNFFGASAAAESALLGNIELKKGLDINKLLFGKGFLGKEVCKTIPEYEPSDGVPTEASGAHEECQVVTPGDTVSQALSRQLDSGRESLLAADEIDEVISALFQQLALKVFTGTQGLLGLAEKDGQYGATPYIDQINNRTYDSVPGKNDAGEDFILVAIKNENEYRALWTSVVVDADKVLARITERQATSTGEVSTSTCPMLETIRTRVTAIRTKALPRKESGEQNLVILDALQARYVRTQEDALFSTTGGEELSKVVSEFTHLQSGGVLHSETDVGEAKILIEGSGIDDTPIESPPVPGIPLPIRQELEKLATQLESLVCPPPGGGSEGGGGGSP